MSTKIEYEIHTHNACIYISPMTSALKLAKHLILSEFTNLVHLSTILTGSERDDNIELAYEELMDKINNGDLVPCNEKQLTLNFDEEWVLHSESKDIPAIQIISAVFSSGLSSGRCRSCVRRINIHYDHGNILVGKYPFHSEFVSDEMCCKFILHDEWYGAYTNNNMIKTMWKYDFETDSTLMTETGDIVVEFPCDDTMWNGKFKFAD